MTMPTTKTPTATEREQAWARQVRATASRRQAEARIAERQAVADVVEALKAEPWVKALAEVGAAKHRAQAITAEDREAARVLDQPVPPERNADTSVAHYLDGSVLGDYLLRPVARAADAVAAELAAAEAEQRQAERAKALESDDLVEQVAADEQSVADDPVAAFDRRPRVEKYTTSDKDGRELTVRRDMDSGETLLTDEDGKIVPPVEPEPAATRMPAPPAWATGGPQVWPPTGD